MTESEKVLSGHTTDIILLLSGLSDLVNNLEISETEKLRCKADIADMLVSVEGLLTVIRFAVRNEKQYRATMENP